MNFIAQYLGEVSQELKKVTWPTKQQTTNQTLLVVVVSLTIALYLSGIDLLIQKMMQLVIN